MAPKDHVFALLLAGGRGTRFWPLSREDHPKQLLRLLSDRTLVQEAYERIRPLVPPERVLVGLSKTLLTRLMTLLPDVPRENFIVEPVPRNTAPCIAVAAKKCLKRHKDAVLIVLPSDHYIADVGTFLDVISSAVVHAEAGRVVTIGITPTHPETGYGYIRFGEFLEEPSGSECRHRARAIQAFVEKPDQETAISYLKAGRYLWNSGMFVFRADVILEKVAKHLPGLATAVEELDRAEEAEAGPAEIERLWSRMPDISIDYGVMEKAEGLVVIPASFGWSDVGTWRALTNFPSDERGNFIRGRVVALESKGNVLYCTHGVLATVGLEDTVVVVTKGAVLVCPLQKTQEVKALVAELKKQGLDELL